MIQKRIGKPKDELQIILKLHHQPSVNHDVTVFWYIKCSLINMFAQVKDQTVGFFNFDIGFDLWNLFQIFQNVNIFFQFDINK